MLFLCIGTLHDCYFALGYTNVGVTPSTNFCINYVCQLESDPLMVDMKAKISPCNRTASGIKKYHQPDTLEKK